MPQSLAKMYGHIVFSTQERRPWLDSHIEDRLFSYLGEMCRSLDCQPVRVGGHQDHVHILCMLSRKVAIMELLKEIKIHSSRWMKEQGKVYEDFYWQKGYAIFSVRHQDVNNVIAYIANQRQHHQKQSFKEEYLAFLNKYEVDYDERYIWD